MFLRLATSKGGVILSFLCAWLLSASIFSINFKRAEGLVKSIKLDSEIERLNDGPESPISTGDNDQSVALVHYWTQWCVHCHEVSELMRQLDAQPISGIRLYEADTTYNIKLAQNASISHYPTVQYHYNGHVGHYHGIRSIDALMAFIRRLRRIKAVQDIGNSAIESLDTYHVKGDVAFIFESVACLSEEETMKITPSKSKLSLVEGGDIAKVAEEVNLETDIYRRNCGEDTDKDNEKYVLYKKEFDGSSPSRTPYVRYVESQGSPAEFIRKANRAMVLEYSQPLLKHALAHSKFVVMAVIDPKNPSHHPIRDQFADKVMEIHHLEGEVFHHVSFGILDGIKYKQFAMDHDVHAPCILVLKSSSQHHYVTNLLDDSIEKNSKNYKDNVGSKYVNNNGNSNSKQQGNKRGEDLMAVAVALDELLDQIDELDWIPSVPAGTARRLLYKMKLHYPYSLLIFVPIILLYYVNHAFKPADDYDKNK